MKKIKVYLCVIFFILILLCGNKVKAAGTISLSASKSTVSVGDEFSVSVNLSGASVATLTARVTVDTSKVDYVSGPSNSSFSNGRAIYTWTDPTGGDNPKTGGTIVTFKFRAKATGKASFSVSGDFYSPSETNINPSFSGTSVTIQEKQVVPPTNNNGGTGGSTGGSSGGATGGTTNKPSGGTSNKPSTGTNNNTSSVSKNANLKELHLDVEGLSPRFNKNTTNYSIVVGDNVDSITVNAIPEDSNASVNVTGNTGLAVGVNKINIKVTAPDKKTTKTYTINVTKTANPDLANAGLENLAIENVILTPEFSADIFEYSAKVGSTIDILNILAVPQIEGANVTIQGNENLQFGENIITISVVAKDGITKNDYIINVYKKTAEEEEQEARATSIEETNEENISKSNLNTGTIAFLVIVVSSIGGLIFIIIRKYVKERK